MNRKIEKGLKKLLVLFILLLFFSVPVMGYSWNIWHSLDKSQYSAGTHGEASITLQNTGTTKIHITGILITLDWMEEYPHSAYTKDVNVYLDVGDKEVLGDVYFPVPSTVSAGYHSYKVGVGMEELVEGWFGNRWEDKGWVWASKTHSVNIIHIGSVSVSSTPTGASIYLDGNYKGITPKTISDVPVGTHSLLLTKAGYYDETATIIVVLNQVAYVSERLDAKTGTIAVSSDPSGAMVYLDDRYKGVTPLTISDVPEGVHTVKLTKSGYKAYWETVYVSAGSKESVSGNLRLIPTPTPTTSVPAFEVMFAIAGLLAVTYLLRRKK